MSHNRQLNELLTQVRQTTEKARSEEDFGPAFSALRRFRQNIGPIKYNNRPLWWLLFGTCLASGILALLYFLNPAVQAALGDFGYILLGLGAVTFVCLLVAICLADSDIASISDLMFKKDIFFDNSLREISVRGDGSEAYERLRREFGDFRSRGDEGRRIVRLVEGQWHGRRQTVTYRYYVFRYVRVYHVPVTQKVGNTTVTTMQRRTETLYRRGLILDFPYAKGLAVRSAGGDFDYIEAFQTGSEEFGRTFEVLADSAQEAAKFLKPAVILACLEEARHFDGLNLEVSRGGRLNLSFYDGDVLELDRRHSIAEPDEFEAEIRSHLGLPKLHRLLRLAETLRRHNDSNF